MRRRTTGVRLVMGKGGRLQVAPGIDLWQLASAMQEVVDDPASSTLQRRGK